MTTLFQHHRLLLLHNHYYCVTIHQQMREITVNIFKHNSTIGLFQTWIWLQITFRVPAGFRLQLCCTVHGISLCLLEKFLQNLVTVNIRMQSFTKEYNNYLESMAQPEG